MDNTFKHSVSLKLEKKSGLAHLSIRTSEYKVEVFKLNISDIGSILMQFSDAMRDQEWEEIKMDPIVEENNENNDTIGSGN
jgi:L-rhamnose mutarotase